MPENKITRKIIDYRLQAMRNCDNPEKDGKTKLKESKQTLGPNI